MVSFKAFNLLIQESYDVKCVAYARSQESTNRMFRTLLNIIIFLNQQVKSFKGHYKEFKLVILNCVK
jgi:hypothetical protein